MKRNLTRKIWGEETNGPAELKVVEKKFASATSFASFVSRTNTIRQSDANTLIDNR